MIRKLDPDRDTELYRQCWGWHESLPEWAKESLAPYSVETFEEFLDLARGDRANIGVFRGDEMVAVISLELIAVGVYELHLSSGRRPPRELIIEAMVNVIKVGFEELGAQLGFSFTPSYDRGIIAMVRAVGMRQDGVERLRCSSNGKIVKWIRSVITRADYEELIADVGDTKTDAEPNGNRTVHAAGQFDDHEHASSEYAGYQSAA